jgi:hypothetical protein
MLRHSGPPGRSESLKVRAMARKKALAPNPGAEVYRTFDSSLTKLAYFLGITETWYGKQVRILGDQFRKAGKELNQVEREMDGIGEKSRSAKADKRRLERLMDKADDLTDVHMFAPLEKTLFRQFPELIRVLGLVYLVAIFETYVVDIVREILLTCPSALKSGRQCAAETIIKLGDRKQIISYLAEKEVDDLLYRSFPDVVNYFDKKFGINLDASGVSSENIVEILATRNIHVHNRGIVNQRYLEWARGSTSRVGAYKPITREYLRESIDSISSLAGFINTEVQGKYFASQDASRTDHKPVKRKRHNKS